MTRIAQELHLRVLPAGAVCPHGQAKPATWCLACQGTHPASAEPAERASELTAAQQNEPASPISDGSAGPDSPTSKEPTDAQAPAHETEAETTAPAAGDGQAAPQQAPKPTRVQRKRTALTSPQITPEKPAAPSTTTRKGREARRPKRFEL